MRIWIPIGNFDNISWYVSHKTTVNFNMSQIKLPIKLLQKRNTVHDNCIKIFNATLRRFFVHLPNFLALLYESDYFWYIFCLSSVVLEKSGELRLRDIVTKLKRDLILLNFLYHCFNILERLGNSIPCYF